MTKSVATQVSMICEITRLTFNDYSSWRRRGCHTLTLAIMATCVLLITAGSASAANILIPVQAKNYVYDNTHETLFMTTNGSGNLQRYDTAAQTLLTPYSVGLNLTGIDITANDQHLYIGDANTVGNDAFVRKVDVTTGATTDLTYNVSVSGGERGVVDISIAANNKALFTTTYAGSGPGTIREIDLTTDTITTRHGVHENFVIDRGHDRSLLFLRNASISSYPFIKYDPSTDSFPVWYDSYLPQSGKDAAVNRDGTQVVNRDQLFDSSLTATGTIPSVAVGYTYDPQRDILYYADHIAEDIVVYDPATSTELDRFAIGESVSHRDVTMDISADTNRLFIRTPSGVRMIDNPMSVNSAPSNASFDSLSDLDSLDIDFGTVLLNDAVSPIDFDITNLGGTGPVSNLTLSSILGSGNTSALSTDLASFSGLLGGTSLTFSSFLETSVAGNFGASYDLSFTDTQGTNQSLTLNLSGIVAAPLPANASFATGSDVDVLDVDFGTVSLGASVAPSGFQLANLLGAGFTADLDLVGFNGTGNTSALTTDLAAFVDLQAGDFLDFAAAIDTSLLGNFNASYELSFTDELGTDQTLTLNLSGEVELTDDPAIPDLIYNAATGEVILDPDASSIIGYTLQNLTAGFLPGGFTPILGGVSTALTSELAEAALSPGSGSIGFVFPIGMDVNELFNFLDVNQVSTGLGAPLVPFDLIVIPEPVPEPSTYVMAGLALLGFGFYGCRRCNHQTRRNAAGSPRHRGILPGVGRVAVVAIVLTLPSSASAGLFGVTEVVGGELSLVEIDTVSGAATTVADFTVDAGIGLANLAFHTPSGRFLARRLQSPGVPPALIALDPVTETSSVVPIVGLPSGEQKVNGVAYDAANNQILITFGFFPNTEQRIAEVDLSGSVLNLSPNLGIGDRDFLAFDPIRNALLGYDSNGDSPRLAVIDDPFGTPSITGLADPPIDLRPIDLAVSPNSGRMFTTYGSDLVELVVSNDSYATIGSHQLSVDVVGLAFAAAVPEPSTYVMAGLSLMGLGLFGWRRRSARSRR